MQDYNENSGKRAQRWRNGGFRDGGNGGFQDGRNHGGGADVQRLACSSLLVELCGFLFEDEAIPSAWSCSTAAAAVPVGAAAAVAGWAAAEAVLRWASTRMRVRTRVPSQSLVNACTTTYRSTAMCGSKSSYLGDSRSIGLGNSARTLRGPLACRQAHLRPLFAPLLAILSSGGGEGCRVDGTMPRGI